MDTVTERHKITLARTLGVSGDCGNYFLISELANPADLVMLMLTLTLPTNIMRVLQENESYYGLLDQTKLSEIDDPGFDDLDD